MLDAIGVGSICRPRTGVAASKVHRSPIPLKVPFHAWKRHLPDRRTSSLRPLCQEAELFGRRLLEDGQEVTLPADIPSRPPVSR